MATVTKSSTIISTPIITAASSNSATVVTASYTVPANSYAIVTVNTITLGGAPGAAANYSIAQPGYAIQNSTAVALDTPVRGIYLSAGNIITISVVSATSGTTDMILTGVLFTNS
jgi:hypothetical protein